LLGASSTMVTPTGVPFDVLTPAAAPSVVPVPVWTAEDGASSGPGAPARALRAPIKVMEIPKATNARQLIGSQ
jgi:hypothetical protein